MLYPGGDGDKKYMSGKKVIIIGGGISGLCTGVYLRKNGFETEILEMHKISGGLATGWKRGDYTFENCVHWLVGSKDGGYLNKMWKEVFDIGKIKFHDDEIYQVIEDGGKVFTVYKDPDKLEQEMLSIGPEDAGAIKEYTGAIRKLIQCKFPVSDNGFKKTMEMLEFLKYLPLLGKYTKISMGDFGRKFKNPLLRKFFIGGKQEANTGMSELSSLAIIFSLAWMGSGNGAYPIGGSLKMMKLIEENYKKLGGQIQFRKKVEKIIVEGGSAKGVILADGSEIRGDIVISAADGYATLFKMLDGKYIHPKHKNAFDNFKHFPSYLQVSYGIADDMAKEPGFLTVMLDKEIQIDPETTADSVTFRVFNYDRTFSPEGKTAVVVFIPCYNHQYWQDLREKDRDKYKLEKQRVADEITAVLERRFPYVKGKIEETDVASPASVIRYTGNWKGSMEGWLPTPKSGFSPLPDTVQGLNNFYLVGQWVAPGGGLPGGLMGGRALTKKICKVNGVKFKS